MRKIFALLAVAFGVMSCQTDVNDFGANVGGEQDVNITVSLPEATRANSALGAFENVDMTKYDIRYIFQVFNANGTANKEMQYVYSDETTVTFPVRLIAGREYNFAVWADLVENGEETNDNYTIGTTLQDISLNEWAPMDETRDAYTGKWSGEFSGAQGITIPLTRPFAKLRVVTTDMLELLGVTPAKAMVEYTTNHYAKFNAFEQQPEEKTVAKTHDTFDIVSYNESGAKKTLFTDYIFAKNTQEVVNFNLSVFDQSDVIIGEVKSFSTDIPVKRNTLTTIEGNILTVGDDITVKIEDAFAQPDNWVFDAFVNGGEVTLDKDYEIGSTLYVEADVVLNLNGKTITNTNRNQLTDVIVVKGNGKLTINGNGTIEAATGNDGYAIIVRDDAELVINGGTYKSGVDENNEPNAVIYARDRGAVYVNGGTFPNDNNSKYVLNKRDADRATAIIKVRGGKFQNFNPADNAAENPGTNFCAEGYGAFDKQDGWFEVFYTGGASTINAVVNNAADLKTAMAQGGVIILAEGEFGTIVAKSNVTLVGTENAKVDAVNLNGADNVTLRNINFDAAKAVPCVDGDGSYKMYANIMTGVWQEAQSNKGAHNLVIDGCAFVGSFKTGKPGSAIAFADYHRTSGYSGNVTIKNCVFETSTDFGGYDIYGYYFGDSTNGHGDFVIENNTFSSTRPNGLPVYMGKYASSTPVVVNGNAFNTVSSLDNAVYLQDHSNYGVSMNATNNTFAQ